MMAHAEATQAMPIREFIGNFALLIVGGNDTTRNSMTGGLMAVLENPAELDKVRADRRPARQPGVGDHPLADAGDPHAAHGDARRRARRPRDQARATRS